MSAFKAYNTEEQIRKQKEEEAKKRIEEERKKNLEIQKQIMNKKTLEEKEKQIKTDYKAELKMLENLTTLDEKRKLIRDIMYKKTQQMMQENDTVTFPFLSYDYQTNILYVHLSDLDIDHTMDVANGMYIDMAADGRYVGLEIILRKDYSPNYDRNKTAAATTTEAEEDSNSNNDTGSKKSDS